MDEFDVAIVGSGLVGLATALALHPTGLRLALIAREPEAQAPDQDEWDSRVYAVSPGSAALLSELGAWRAVPAERVTPVESMLIYGDDGRARIEFSAYDAGLRELAFIAENRVLLAALWRRAGAAGIRVFRATHCRSLRIDSDAAVLTLDDGASVAARLVVGADGANSWVRDQAGILAFTADYRQHAVVANFSCEKPHRAVAYQWFRRDGVLALLPLAGNRVSMVWSAGNERAQELLAAPGERLTAEVGAATGDALGRLTLITPPASFPLRLQRVESFVRPRVALVGDAAHNVHPLAGQGVNLGFRDGRALAQALDSREARYDCGEYPVLRRYERARREDVAAMQATTHGLQKLFALDIAWAASARNLGLRLVDHQPQLKNFLVRRAVA